MGTPTVVVIDDHGPFRRAARAVVEAAGCAVGGEAEAADQARALLATTPRPDLVLMDIHLGTDSGLDLTRELTTADPELRVVLVSTMDERDLPSDMAEAGALGFVPKSTLSPEAIRHLVAGGKPGDGDAR